MDDAPVHGDTPPALYCLRDLCNRNAVPGMALDPIAGKFVVDVEVASGMELQRLENDVSPSNEFDVPF
jgi:hypothetical protein